MFDFLQSLNLPSWLNSDNAIIVLTAASGLVAALKEIAKLTATKADDKWLGKIGEFVHDALRWVPTIEVGGPSVADKEVIKAVKAETSNVVQIADAKALNSKAKS